MIHNLRIKNAEIGELFIYSNKDGRNIQRGEILNIDQYGAKKVWKVKWTSNNKEEEIIPSPGQIIMVASKSPPPLKILLVTLFPFTASRMSIIIPKMSLRSTFVPKQPKMRKLRTGIINS
jgi:hypothetical protein